MIADIREINFPDYATLSQATVVHNEMGDLVITTQVAIDGSIRPDFSYNWEVEFMGERYIHPIRTPQALKDNTSICSKIDLTFEHWMVYELKRNYFVELASVKSGTVIPNKYITPLGLSITDFVVAFRNVLDYYYKGAIQIQLNPDIEYSDNRVFINISYSYLWDVLQTFYSVYGIRWYIQGNTIYVGYEAPEISHIFEYGYNKGLISLERQVQDSNIRNSLLGRGGATNLPRYYFKNAPEGSIYASDPDAIPELEYIPFTELRGKTFRDYIQGWKTNPNRDTKNGTIAVQPYNAQRGEIDFAYKKGHEDITFDPIEYVKDDDSIAKYGLLPGGLDNNESIYPSIQSISLNSIGLVNEIVAVEPVLSDDVDSGVEDEAIIETKNPASVTYTAFGSNFDYNRNYKMEIPTVSITVEDGYLGTLLYSLQLKVSKWDVKSCKWVAATLDVDYKISQEPKVQIRKYGSNEVVSDVNIQSGNYFVDANIVVNSLRKDTNVNFEFVMSEIKLVATKFDNASEIWKPTFDVWIKNIWQTEKLDSETDKEYADRVWLPILGDAGREAMVTFASGWLSSSEGWEFKIINGGYAYDSSKSYNGVSSHWRLTLQKSDAELNATGKYVPNMGMQAVAGDTFFFTGIDMQHQYVLYAEQRLDEWKSSNLEKSKEIQPTWISKLDKVRINTLEADDTNLLINSIKVGAWVHLADSRFIDGVIDRYIQSVTYTYSDKLKPDIEIVLSDTLQAVANPVQQLQGQIDSLAAQITRPTTTWFNQLRKIFDSIYLRKDGVEDLSKSPTSFQSIVKSDNFRAGIIGGTGWGIYRDIDGRTIAEFDQINARTSIQSNSYVINEVKHQGGIWVQSAASIEVERVEETTESYICYFNTRGGSLYNQFVLNDIAYCQRFDSYNNPVKSYKSRVIAIGDDYISLSKTDSVGGGVPAEQDIIIHYGNTVDLNRQFVVIRDVIGGGYERMISGLNSVNSQGLEYYFAGRINGESPRWFIGDKNAEYAEWKDNRMTIKGDFILRNSNQSVDTMFAITEEGIKASVESLQAEAVKGKTLLYNASFTQGLDGWITSDDSLNFTGGVLLLSGGSAVTNTVYVSGTPIFDNVYCLTVNNGWIRQSNDLFVDKPQFDEDKQYPLFFSVNVRCKTQGTLIVKVGENEIYNAIVEPNEKFISIDVDGKTWNGQGDFYLSFSGEADFYGLTIFTEKTEVRHKAIFEVQAGLSQFAQQNIDNATGEIKQESGLMIKPTGTDIYVFDGDKKEYVTLGKFYTDEDGKKKIELTGDDIILSGDISANGNVHIDAETGTITAKDGVFENGVFSGKVTSEEGEIGGFEITPSQLISSYTEDTSSKKMALKAEYIYFEERKKGVATNSVWLGTSTATEFSEAKPTCRIEVDEDKTYIFEGNENLKAGTNVGLYVKAKGDMSGKDISPLYGNHAILCPNGDYAGFRMRTRRVDGSTTLSVLDNIILVARIGIILTLPENAEDGQIYIIKSYAGSTDGKTKIFTCQCQGEDKMWGWKDGGGNINKLEAKTNQTLIMHYDAVNKYWMASYLATLD